MTTSVVSKSALITGASRGIGLGIAIALARQGYSLTITARDCPTLDTAAELLRGAGAADVVTVAIDMAANNAAEAIVTAHADRFSTMNALILNAGVGTAGPIIDYPMKRVDRTVDVNFRAPFEILQRSLALLKLGATEHTGTGARVIALSSLTGVYAEAGLAAYGATKAAMLSLIETLNAEEGVHGVSGTAIAPGYVETDMSAWVQDRISAESMIRVDDIVELATAILRLSPHAVVPRIVISRAGAGLHA